MRSYVHSNIKVRVNPFGKCDSFEPQYLSGIFAMYQNEEKRKIVVTENPEILKQINKVSLSFGCWQ
jgi:hypothetical protein